MYKILNTTIESINDTLSVKLPQRISVDFITGTNFEIMIIPLNDDWSSLRMTGTDDRYFGIGVAGYGFYPFLLNNVINVGYVATKLRIPYEEAECLTFLLNDLKPNFYE